MSVRGYTVAVDWSGAGTFTRTGEDVTSYLAQDVDVTITYGRDLSSATLATVSGGFSIALRNDDRRFSPENTSSPLTGKVVSGKQVLVTQTDAGGATWILGSGPIDKITTDPNAADYRFVGSVLDPWGIPGTITLSTPVYQGYRTGDLIGVILDAIGWTGPRDVDPGVTVVPCWWEEGTDAATAITKLVNSEGHPAMAYVRGGTFVFRDRHARLFSARSQTSQGLFTHIYPAGTGPGGDYKILKDAFVYDHGMDYVANYATQAVSVRSGTDLMEVWSSEDAVTIPVGTTAVVTVNPSDPFVNAVTPVIGQDIMVASGSITVAMSRASGASTTLFITATGDAVLTRMALRANALPVTRTVTVTALNQASVTKYSGRRQWVGDIPWANQYDAQAILNKVVTVYGDNIPTVSFTISDAVGPTYLAKILSLDEGDRITIRNDIIGVNADFIVENVTRTIRQLTVHELAIGARLADPAQPANVFTFDVAGKGFDQGAFGADGIDNPTNVFLFDVAGQGFDQGVFAT